MCSLLQRMMKLNLGKPDGKNEGFFVMNVKSMMLIVPAIILGHYLDEGVERLKLNTLQSVLVQTFLNVFLIFLLHRISVTYTREFQVSLAGLFFSALFFGMQTNYIKNLKVLLA